MYPKLQKTSVINLWYQKFKVFSCILAGYFIPENKKVKLLIFAQGRSGSTLLESLLCSTGYFSKQGEPLGIYFNVLFRPLDFLIGYARLKKEKIFFAILKFITWSLLNVTMKIPKILF